MQAIHGIATRVRLRQHEGIVVTLALALAAACAASAWFVSGRHFMLPLDDSYIHLQYARQLANLEVFSYTHGADPSGGATSPLWIILLAPFFVLGIKGVLGALAAFGLGSLIWTASAILVGRITLRATGHPVAGLAASLLFVLNGHLLWNFVNGMETGLFAFLILAVIHSFAEWDRDGERHHLRRLLVALALLPICRPEGFLLSGAALVVLALQRGHLVPAAKHWAVFIPGLGWLALLKVLTGEWKPSGLLAKGLMERSDIGLVTKLQIMAETLVAIPTRFYRNVIPDDGYALFKGTDYMPYLPGGLAFVALAAGALLVASDWRARRAGLATMAMTIWLVGLGSLAISGLPFIHQQRYLVPWTPIIILLAVIGIQRLASHLKAPTETTMACSAVFMLLSLPSVPFWVIEFGRNASDIYRQHRVMSFSVAANERLAVTDTGVLAYYTDAAVLDFVGLTSARYTRSFSAGESALLEMIGTDWEPWRPTSIITYRHWFSPDFPLGMPSEGAYIDAPSIVAGQYLARYPIEWERIDLGRSIPLLPGETRIDDVNVASLAGEKNSNYEWRMNRDDERRGTWPRPNMPVATTRNGGVAGGRFVRAESFDVRPEEGTDPASLVLIARVARSRPDASPPAFARTLELTATSLDSGLGASMQFEIPEHTPGAIPEPRIPLGDLLQRAGGTRWRFSLRAVEPDGDAWHSFNYIIVSQSR